MTINEQVLKIINNKIGVIFNDNQLNDKFEHTKLDSIDLLELIMYIEKDFDLDIPDHILENAQTVNDLCNIIQELKNEHPSH